jgi:hypothetical protein
MSPGAKSSSVLVAEVFVPSEDGIVERSSS